MTDIQNDPDRVIASAAPRAPTATFEPRLVGARDRRHRRAPARRDRRSTGRSRSAGTSATPARSATRTRSGSRASRRRSARRTTTRPPRRTWPTASPRARCSTARRRWSRSPTSTRTRFLLMFGANPFVSHGSVLTAPKVKEQLHAIVERGGRVVVVDPRRTETARHFEHVAGAARHRRLAAALAALRAGRGGPRRRGRARRGRPRAGTSGARRRSAFPPEQTAARTGVAGGRRARARARPRGRRRRRGLRPHGLLPGPLRHARRVPARPARTLATGNIDRPGGAVFGLPAIALDEVAEQAGLDTYGKVRSRIGDFPDVLGALPASLMAREMTTPGERQIRAFFTSAGNPVLSCPDGEALEQALETLELLRVDRPLRQRDQPPRRLHPAEHDLARARRPADRLPGLLHDAVRAVRRARRRAARRGARGVADHRRDRASEIGIAPYAHPALRLLARLGYRITPKRLRRHCCCARAATATCSACARAGSA